MATFGSPVILETLTHTTIIASPLRMSTMMRAVLIKNGKGPIENLYIGDIERPQPNEGQVLVKVSAHSDHHLTP